MTTGESRPNEWDGTPDHGRRSTSQGTAGSTLRVTPAWTLPDDPDGEPTTPVAVRHGDTWGVVGHDADRVSEIVTAPYGLAILVVRGPKTIRGRKVRR